VQHLYSNVFERTLDCYPPSCELDKILNATIAACDNLDGRSDGVVSRSDLCKLNFNLISIIGLTYSCAAETSTSLGLEFGNKKRQSAPATTPAQNGTVSANGVEVAQTILNGLRGSQGRQAYLSYQPEAEFEDATTIYDSTTGTWGLDIARTGVEWVGRFLERQDVDNLSNLDNVTYDTLVEWMTLGWKMYTDTLQTKDPDLTAFYEGGGEVLHFRGESDPGVPTASSVYITNQSAASCTQT